MVNRQERITKLLQTSLDLTYLTVENESIKHHVPIGSETHFKVVAVGEVFNNMPVITRHRYVNTLLSHELKLGLHALSLHLYTLSEWEVRNKQVARSPACKDGLNQDKSPPQK